MIEVRRKVSDSTAELGTLIEEQGVVAVLGVAKLTFEEADGSVMFPSELYQSRADALRDGWAPV